MNSFDYAREEHGIVIMPPQAPTEALEYLPGGLVEELLADLNACTGVRASIRSCTGESIARSAYQNPLCASTQLDPRFRSMCKRCTAAGDARAAALGGMFTYVCYRGLVVTTAPVFIKGSSVASIAVSGFLTDESMMAGMERIAPDGEHPFRRDELHRAPYLHMKRARDTVNVAAVAAKYLSELSARRMAEKELLEQARARVELEKLHSQAELQALQAQINPHFLFNTLNSISQLAVLEGAEKTPEAIYALAHLIRVAYHTSEAYYTLRDELDYVGEYLAIKRLLLGGRISFLREIDESCLDAPILPFTLQPLVENSLLHGLEPREGPGTLRLSVRREGFSVRIDITDDGLGCDAATLQHLRSADAAATRRGELTGFGFGSVVSRLRLRFGEGFRYDVRSAPGEGTAITMYIPREVDPA